ncbi:MAG: hypothetical protein GYA42_01795 [Syntrophomonadaceae bacterium]|nr:hypothetical protein [Syntrophomonadaceae bacterium]
MAIVTLILAAYVGDVLLAQVDRNLLLLTMRTAFTIFTVLCVLGIFASIARGKAHTEDL